MTRERLNELVNLSNTIDNIECVLKMLEHENIVVSLYNSDGEHDYSFSSLDNGFEFTRNLIIDALKKKLKEYQEEFERG